MDDKAYKIIKGKLSKWKGKPINQERLGELKQELTKKTGSFSNLPLSTLKKWVDEARKGPPAKAAKAKPKAAVKAKKPAKAAAKKPAKAAKPVKHAAKAKPAPKAELRIRKVKREVSESLGEIKAGMYAGRQAKEEIEPVMESKEIILQNIGFELATVKQLLDRINRQLNVIEVRLAELMEEEED